MNLLNEDFEAQKKAKKSKKTTTILLISMIIVFILIIVVLCLIVYIKGNTLTVTLDGQANADIKEMLVFEEDGTTYIPIRSIATYLGYRSYNGDYTNRSEEVNQCYIESEQEIATFSLNSNKIYKISPNATDYDYFYIDKPIKSIDGKLYTTIDGIEKAFNVKFTYNDKKKTINIETMDYVFNNYKTDITNNGFDGMSEDFEDKKAILKNLAIVTDNRDYGIFNVATEEIMLETKYDKISYIETTGDFLVESNDKIGIISDTGKTKVSISYDSIEVMDKDLKLYLVEKDNKYGVIDFSEKTIIPIDYNEIGIDISAFEKNNIKNKFILVDNLIPVKMEKFWGLFNLKGEQVTDYKYDSFGYKATTNRDAENLLIIPEYNVVIACKDKRYIVINSLGEELWDGNSFDEVYMKTTNTYDNVTQTTVSSIKYYLVLNGKEYDAEDQLDKIGVNTNKDNKTNKEQQNSQENENNNNSQNNNVEANQEENDNQENVENNSQEENIQEDEENNTQENEEDEQNNNMQENEEENNNMQENEEDEQNNNEENTEEN